MEACCYGGLLTLKDRDALVKDAGKRRPLQLSFSVIITKACAFPFYFLLSIQYHISPCMCNLLTRDAQDSSVYVQLGSALASVEKKNSSPLKILSGDIQ